MRAWLWYPAAPGEGSVIDGKPRILIVRLSAIGDVVRVLPALHVLREAHPDARIDWAVERKSSDIVLGHPALDETLIFDRPRGLAQSFRSFAAFCRTVRKNRYDVVIDFHGLFKTGLIAASSGASQRYGFARPRAQEGSFLFTNRKVRLVNPRMNRVEENLALIEGRAPNYRWPNITLYVPSSVQEEVDAFFDSTFESGKLVVAMHVPVDRAEKRWPDAHFAALADMLLADGRFEVMLTWGPGQFEALESVLRHAHRHPVIAPETPTLKHYAWLAHRSAAYVGGDTGPMHIAAAMGTPVVAIFGDTDPAKHAPCRLPHIVLHNATPGISAAERLASITPEIAYDACLDLLFGVKPDGPR
ncbi:MAG TPA: glycosyltransferase family 9 protein [Candidatus Hydrogenedentes bacterium]|nr:glycosyltransferase family 9 protein [Candidatus Hydrogenedentota bacterium]